MHTTALPDLLRQKDAEFERLREVTTFAQGATENEAAATIREQIDRYMAGMNAPCPNHLVGARYETNYEHVSDSRVIARAKVQFYCDCTAPRSRTDRIG